MPGAKQRHDDGNSQATLIIVSLRRGEDAQLLRLMAELLDVCAQADVLVVGGREATRSGKIVDSVSKLNPRIHWHEHETVSGCPEIEGIQWGLRRNYEHVVQMDGGFVHDPRSIPTLLERLTTADLAVGSRYCPRGAILSPSWVGRLCSRLAGFAARMFLGLTVRDGNSGLRAWRRSGLERIRWDRVDCSSATVHAESAYLASRVGLRITEVPILWVEGVKRTPRYLITRSGRLGRALIRLAGGRLFRGRHPALPAVPWTPVKEPKRILVLALGGIGDTVLGFAMFRRLRQTFPRSSMTALGMWPQSADLLKDLGIFDEVLDHHFQRESWWRSLCLTWRLRRCRFDISIQAFPANRFEYNALHWLIGARRRIGHDYLRGSHWTYLRWLLTDRVTQVLGTHNIHENLKLLECLGISQGAAIDPSLGPLAPEYRAYADDVLRSTERPIVGLHAGSSTYKNLHAKRWPPERFAEVARRLAGDFGCQPVLFEGPGDEDVCERIVAQCPSLCVLRAPSIRHTAALIQHCSLFVSNDTALAHLASALEVPTLMLVGPTDPCEIGPFSGKGTALAVAPNCAPCFRVSRRSLTCHHPEPFACMKIITVAAVLDEVWRLLKAQPSIRTQEVTRMTTVCGGQAGNQGQGIGPLVPLRLENRKAAAAW